MASELEELVRRADVRLAAKAAAARELELAARQDIAECVRELLPVLETHVAAKAGVLRFDRRTLRRLTWWCYAGPALHLLLGSVTYGGLAIDVHGRLYAVQKVDTYPWRRVQRMPPGASVHLHSTLIGTARLQQELHELLAEIRRLATSSL